MGTQDDENERKCRGGVYLQTPLPSACRGLPGPLKFSGVQFPCRASFQPKPSQTSVRSMKTYIALTLDSSSCYCSSSLFSLLSLLLVARQEAMSPPLTKGGCRYSLGPGSLLPWPRHPMQEHRAAGCQKKDDLARFEMAGIWRSLKRDAATKHAATTSDRAAA